jgi:hypothetical protein
MFVRFRQQGHRLQPSLLQTRRVAGKGPRAEHIASLGSVDADVSVRERLAFWARLPSRLASLGNRLGPDEHPKIYEALHARIPMVTPDEQRAIQEENAKDDERVWDTLLDLNASHIEGHKALIATVEAKIAEMAPEVERAAERVEVARNRLEKLKRGEDVADGLGKPPDIVAVLKAAGWTPSMMRRGRLLNSLTETEFKMVLESSHSAAKAAADKATEREARRIIRARKP